MSFDSLINIAIPTMVGIISSVTTYLIARGNNVKDISINHRQQLSEDEKNFRQELKSIVDSYKGQLEEALGELRTLRKEVAELHTANLNLTLENKHWRIKVEELLEQTRGDRNEMD